MKKSTVANKLNELLGITTKVEEVKTKSTGKIVGITEEEIQTFREAQGLIYFLQAPSLFTPKICPHCKEGFMVSRKYVSYCSYTCIEKSLEELGITWSRKGNIDSVVKDIYDGNEPLWIHQSNLKKLHGIVSNLLSVHSEDGTTSQSSQTQQSHVISSGSTSEPEAEVKTQSSLAPSMITPHPQPLKKSTTTNENKPKIIFKDL